MSADELRAAAPLDAEVAIIGSVLTFADAAPLIPELALTGVEFADDDTRAAWGAILALHGRGAAIDPVAVADELTQRGRADVCPLSVLTGWCHSATRLDALMGHAERLRRAHAARQMREIGRQLQQFADDPQRVRELLRGLEPAHGAHAGQFFEAVSIADLAHSAPAPPAYWWDQYMPAGVVTVLSAHGGVGKSLVSLMLAVCIALGLPMFSVPTRRGVVVFYSAEDGPELVRFRLHLVCRGLGVDVAALDGRLHILDATAGDPVLFQEIAARGGQRSGATTPAYAALVEFFDQAGADVLIVDNSSDVFDGSEIARAQVRAFMRALARIAQARAGAVLLLTHVDKSTARGVAVGSDSYSGSTAWSNSARSRLFLSRTSDGGLKLEHQKHNLGRMSDPLALVWPEHGLPQIVEPVGPLTQRLVDKHDTRALLALLHEFYGRGEYPSTSPNARTNVTKLLGGQRGYPRRKPHEVFDLLRDAERAGLIVRECFKDSGRKDRQRWALTAEGLDFIGAATP